MKTQSDSYASLTNRYDDTITARRWWSRLYLHTIWGIDYNEIARETIALLPTPLSGRVLEVPIGTAIFTAPYYLRNPHASICGVDFSPEMLGIAKARLASLGIQHVTLTQADVAALPFPDATFDCVLSMNGMQSFPNKEKALREMGRVLRPGGTLCGSFYVRGHRPLADRIARGPLQRKGIFFGPHWTFEEATSQLEKCVGPIKSVARKKSIIVFSCTKR